MAASAIAAVHPRAAPWRESSFHVERARLSPEALVVRRCSASVGRGRCRPMRASGRHWPTVSRGRTVGPSLESLEARIGGGRVEMAWFESTMEPPWDGRVRPSEPSRCPGREARRSGTSRSVEGHDGRQSQQLDTESARHLEPLQGVDILECSVDAPRRTFRAQAKRRPWLSTGTWGRRSGRGARRVACRRRRLLAEALPDVSRGATGSG